MRGNAPGFSIGKAKRRRANCTSSEAARLPATIGLRPLGEVRGIGDRELQEMERALADKPLHDVATGIARLSYQHMIDMTYGIAEVEGYAGPSAEVLAGYINKWAQANKQHLIEPRGWRRIQTDIQSSPHLTGVAMFGTAELPVGSRGANDDRQTNRRPCAVI